MFNWLRRWIACYRQIHNQLVNFHISPSSKKIYRYISTEPPPVVGNFEPKFKSVVTRKSKVTKFCIVDGHYGNLIGYETAADLGLLHTINSVLTPQSTTLWTKSNSVLRGLVKWKTKLQDYISTTLSNHLHRNTADYRFTSATKLKLSLRI